MEKEEKKERRKERDCKRKEKGKGVKYIVFVGVMYEMCGGKEERKGLIELVCRKCLCKKKEIFFKHMT